MIPQRGDTRGTAIPDSCRDCRPPMWLARTVPTCRSSVEASASRHRQARGHRRMYPRACRRRPMQQSARSQHRRVAATRAVASDDPWRACERSRVSDRHPALHARRCGEIRATHERHRCTSARRLRVTAPTRREHFRDLARKLRARDARIGAATNRAWITRVVTTRRDRRDNGGTRANSPPSLLNMSRPSFLSSYDGAILLWHDAHSRPACFAFACFTHFFIASFAAGVPPVWRRQRAWSRTSCAGRHPRHPRRAAARAAIVMTIRTTCGGSCGRSTCGRPKPSSFEGCHDLATA